MRVCVATGDQDRGPSLKSNWKEKMKSVNFDQRLEELGIELPRAATPSFSYVPTLISGNFLYVSGQLGFWNGELKHHGKLGEGATLADATAAARLCGLNVLAQVRQACGGSLNPVQRCLKMTGFVSTLPTCYDHATAMNGCSELMHDVFGERGRHTRATVGVASLAFDAVVEVDAIFEIDPAPSSAR
jgi:enamine deaminase RidA (YjgF/YER057c/UK114 family)